MDENDSRTAPTCMGGGGGGGGGGGYTFTIKTLVWDLFKCHFTDAA